MLCLNLEEVSSRAVSVLYLLKSTSVIGIATDWESVHSFIISLHSVHRNKRVTVALHLQSKTNIIKVGPPNKKKSREASLICIISLKRYVLYLFKSNKQD